MTTRTLLVTGAGGQLGRRVIAHLLEKNAGRLVATTRNPDALADLAARGVEVRRADFDDTASLQTAFRGVDRALLISTDALDDHGRRLTQHRNAVRAMDAAGVRHVVYTSLPDPVGSVVSIAPDHAGTEAALTDSRVGYTVLRNNLYTDLLLGALPPAIASGQWIDARDDQPVAYVTREDCARAAAAALVADDDGRNTWDVTGPAAVRSRELIATASEVVGRPIAYVPVTADALVAGMVAHGLPAPVAALYGSFDRAIARGELATATDTVQRLTGSAPQSVAAFLAAHREALRATK